MEKPTPKLLKTYEEGRLLITAKGWGLAKAAEHLSEQPGLEPFNVSQASLSRKTGPGDNYPIEPEVAYAVEQLKTQGGYHRQAEIVEAGLRAVHGEPPSVDVRQLAKDLREHLASNELAQKLADTLTEKTAPGSFIDNVACGISDRLRATRLVQELGRVNWKLFVIPAGVGALVACLALLLAPTPPGRTLASPATPLMLIIPGAGPDGSTVRFDVGALLAESKMGEKPLDQPIPVKLLPGQKAPPCDSGVGEEAINAGCWAAQARVKPPCGRLFRRGDECYRPIAAPQKPGEPTPNRPTP